MHTQSRMDQYDAIEKGLLHPARGAHTSEYSSRTFFAGSTGLAALAFSAAASAARGRSGWSICRCSCKSIAEATLNTQAVGQTTAAGHAAASVMQ